MTVATRASATEVRCALPPLADGPGPYRVRLSLNAQQFSPVDTALGFWVLPDDFGVGARAASGAIESGYVAGELSPGAGPVEGGSIVRVPLEGLAWLREDGFTWHDGANNSKRVHLGMQASCKFGVAVVPATVAYESEDSDDGDVEHLECISPNATAAGVAVELGGPSDGGVGVWRAAPLSLGTLPFGDDAADGLYGLNAADAEGMREAVEAAAAEEAANACKPDGCAGSALFAAAGAAFAGSCDAAAALPSCTLTATCDDEAAPHDSSRHTCDNLKAAGCDCNGCEICSYEAEALALTLPDVRRRAGLRASLIFDGGATLTDDHNTLTKDGELDRHGSIRLTGLPGYAEAGSVLLNVSAPYALHEFNFSCELWIRGAGPSDGVSVSYAPQPTRMRQYGAAGGGLRLALLPYASEVSLALDSEVLHLAAHAAVAVTDAPAPFWIAVRRTDDETYAAEAWLGGQKVLPPTTLPGWSSLVKAGWRVGVGGGTAHEDEGGRSTDRPHMISHLWLRAGAAYRPKVAPLTISYNDQDYYAPPTLGFVYGVPRVAAVYPRAARAGTAVTVRGELLPVAGDLSDANLDASGGYQCKWTELVRDGFNTPPDASEERRVSDAWAAAFDYNGTAEERDADGWRIKVGGATAVAQGTAADPSADGGYVTCTTPTLAHGRYALEVSLHGAQYTSSALLTGGVHHIVDGNDELLATPPEAPASVAASVVITGLHLHAGFAYACRVQRNLQGSAYPVAIVPGSYVPSMRGVRCVVPPPVSGDNARVAIKVSLDGGETFNSNGAGNAGAADFYFREPPTLATALDNPRAPIVSSPMGGAALVWLEGTFLGADGASAVECRFGATAVRATRESESRVRCVSPEGDWARLAFGSAAAAPLPALSGEWEDDAGRAVRVCADDGVLVASIEAETAAAAAVWDEQRRAFVGVWQQWRPGGGDATLFTHDGDPANAEAGKDLHSSGFFAWRLAASNESVEFGGATVAATAAEPVVVGEWSSHDARRHFGADALLGGASTGAWSLRPKAGTEPGMPPPLDPGAPECAWLQASATHVNASLDARRRARARRSRRRWAGAFLRNPRRRAARRGDADAAQRQPELDRDGRRRALRHAAEECCRRRAGRARVDAQRLAARVLPRGAAARPPARDCRGRHRPRLVPPRRRALCGPRDWRCALRASAGARRHPRVPRAARRDGRGGDGRRRRPRRRDGGGGRRRLEYECAARPRRDRRAAARARADAPTATGAVDGRWDAAGSGALPRRRLAVERLVGVGRPLHGGA